MNSTKRNTPVLYGTIYMFLMIYMSFEEIIPGELSRWGFVNFCTWQMYISARLEGGIHILILAFTAILYALSIYMIVVRKKYVWFLFPMMIAFVDIYRNAVLIVGHITSILIFVFKIMGLVFMTKAFNVRNKEKGESENELT